MSSDVGTAELFAGVIPSSPLDVVAMALDWCGGLRSSELSAPEREVMLKARERMGCSSALLTRLVGDVTDPFGELLCEYRPREQRRRQGQFFTPEGIVDVMVDWVAGAEPAQVVDAGCGTGRFAVAAARACPQARIVAVDCDPVATLLCRARAKQMGLHNLDTLCADFVRDTLPLGDGRTAFVGNPPYVRHHALRADLKQWGAEVSRTLGVPFSKLSGLHVYFFLATALRARREDIGCFITSAEWLDVRYGRGLRRLLADHLGLVSVSVLADTERAFKDAMTSAAITCFRVGSSPQAVRLSTVPRFTRAEGPSDSLVVSAAQLKERWGARLRGKPAATAGGVATRLGDVVEVHRGVATGANSFFVMDGQEARDAGLAVFARPVVTSAKEVFDSGGVLRSGQCKVLIALPQSLLHLRAEQRKAVERYLKRGMDEDLPARYLCRNRRPWWWLGELRAPPIIATYMARRPPAFALNPDGMLILNIAHGLYPREGVAVPCLRKLVQVLNETAADFAGNGRRYHGGLEKFEPREMEDLLIPANWNEPVRP